MSSVLQSNAQGSRLCLCSVTDNGAYNLDAIELKVGGLPHRDWDQLSLCRFPSTWLLIHKSACSCANGQDPCACEVRVLRNEIGPVLCCGRHRSQTVSQIRAAPVCRPMVMKIIVPPEGIFTRKLVWQSGPSTDLSTLTMPARQTVQVPSGVFRTESGSPCSAVTAWGDQRAHPCSAQHRVPPSGMA